MSTWTGLINTSWANAGNWIGGVPVNDGAVDIPLTAINDLLTDLDRTGDAAPNGLNLATFRRTKGSTVKVGTSTSPLKCTCDLLRDEGDADLYFESRRAAGTNVTGRIIINSEGNLARVNIGGDVNITRMEILAAAKVTISHVSPGTIAEIFFVPINPFTALEQMSSGSITVFHGNGGEAILRSAGTVYWSVGALTIEQVPGVSGNVSVIHQDGGRVTYNGTLAATSPTGDPLIYLMAGIFDADNPLVDTNAGIGTIYVSPQGEFLRGQYLIVTGSIINLGSEF